MTLRPLLLAALLAFPAFASTETRCGWYDHPSPNIVDLISADGSWSISWPGIKDYPPGFKKAYTRALSERVRIDAGGEIRTQGPGYKYSCACMDGECRSDEVIAISLLTEFPISQCANDPDLPDMNPWIH